LTQVNRPVGSDASPGFVGLDRGTVVGAIDSLLLLRGEVARQRLSIRARMTIMVSERGRDMATG
jgi:hypothetical protein